MCMQAESSSSKHASEVQALQQEAATATKVAAASQAVLKKVKSWSLKSAVVPHHFSLQLQQQH